jgi:hypothetical protein
MELERMNGVKKSWILILSFGAAKTYAQTWKSHSWHAFFAVECSTLRAVPRTPAHNAIFAT